MERFKVFEGIRRQSFPQAWKDSVAEQFPSLDKILTKMLSCTPKERPSAGEVASHVESLLNEYTVLSLDHTTAREGSIFLRVEANNSNEGILTRTTKLIEESASNVTILQYSLKGQEKGAIMEFALIVTGTKSDPINAKIDLGNKENEYDQENDPIGTILATLGNSSEIVNARIVNEQPIVRDVNEQNKK